MRDIPRGDVDHGAFVTRLNLCDKWSYFWRLAVVALAEALPKGEHVARIRLEEERPDKSVLKRPPTGPVWQQCKREGKEHKLWLMHWLIEESDERERAMVVPAGGLQRQHGSGDGVASARLGGAGLASGGRRADP